MKPRRDSRRHLCSISMLAESDNTPRILLHPVCVCVPTCVTLSELCGGGGRSVGVGGTRPSCFVLISFACNHTRSWQAMRLAMGLDAGEMTSCSRCLRLPPGPESWLGSSREGKMRGNELTGEPAWLHRVPVPALCGGRSLPHVPVQHFGRHQLHKLGVLLLSARCWRCRGAAYLHRCNVFQMER